MSARRVIVTQPVLNRPWSHTMDPSGRFLINADGLRLNRHEWPCSSTQPRALLFIAHGAGEHMRRYDELALLLGRNGIFVFAHDHVGHGESDGEPVDVVDFNIYVRDVIVDMKATQTRFPGAPIFLLGTSMGGAIALQAGLNNKDLFAGMILVSPAITIDPRAASPCLIRVGKCLAGCCPLMGLSKLDPAALTRNPAAAQQMRDDPLVFHGKMKARWGIAFLNAMQDTEPRLKDVTWPLLVCQGSADETTAGVPLLQSAAPPQNLVVKIYDGLKHEILHDFRHESNIVLQDICDWLNGRLASNPPPTDAPTAAELFPVPAEEGAAAAAAVPPPAAQGKAPHAETAVDASAAKAEEAPVTAAPTPAADASGAEV